jgi:ribulose-5-phosphate 4-epimerase/fuculose-1-phosphate aldolase
VEKIVCTYKKSSLKGKNIYIVLTSARKIKVLPKLVKELILDGASVWIFPTKNAQKMISGLDFGKAKILKDFNWRNKRNIIPEEDFLIIAPCTFNTLNKIRFGIADNYPTTIIASSISKKKKIFIAPSFNEMWYHPITKETIEILTSWGIRIIWPEINKGKVTMIDFGKIVDSLYKEIYKIPFDCCQIESSLLLKKLNDSRRKFFTSFRKLGEKQEIDGLNLGIKGCYSIKIDKDWMLISSTKTELSKLKIENLTLVKLSNNKKIFWVGREIPSSETPLHIACYLNSNAKAIVHSHCPLITYAENYLKWCTPFYVRSSDYNDAIKIVEQIKKQNGFIIMKFHGEVAISDTLIHAHELIMDRYLSLNKN